ncbi:MAG: xanthine dehydrogenase family protein subunit M, partial [Chloroflexi bacterium]|nr:xanthine dehydrogenase family protein subunit M [Chloroflexota bacterium]
MRAFDHFMPQTLPDAFELLAQFNGQGHVNAGGTDLMLKMRAGVLEPSAIISIKRLPELKGMAYDQATGLRMGALTTLRELTRTPFINQHYPVLAQAAGKMASEQVRSFATMGGNLCNGSPSADLAPPLIALGATAVIINISGERHLPLENFFLGPSQTALQSGELLKEIIIPPPLGQTTYQKHSPRAYMDIAVAGVAIQIFIADGLCQQVRIVLGAVAPVPLRVREAELVLEGERVENGRFAKPDLIQQAAQIASETCSPIDDVR